MDALRPYRAKRNFDRTPEPAGTVVATQGGLFVVQKHAATRLHYDLRLELGGVLKSWAVTRGPSLDPSQKRLAVEVEDHPVAYGAFEGTIAPGNYGAGTVMVWDQGSWTHIPHGKHLSAEEDLAQGELKFQVESQRMSGAWVLIRMKRREGERQTSWLLIKERDDHARPGTGAALLDATSSIVTGRTMDEIAAPTEIPEPSAAPPPGFIHPALCTAAARSPTGADWVHELKLDGYRIQAHVRHGAVRLFTRNGHDWTDRFTGAAPGLATLPDAVLDGELVALDRAGNPDFAALQAAIERGKTADLVFFAFDLLWQDKDLRDLPLRDRKGALERLLSPAPAGVRLLVHFDAPGEAVLKSACRLGLEGVVSKKAGSPYVSGRQASWVKAKCRGRDEFVIGGWGHGAAGQLVLLVGAHRTIAGSAPGLVYLGRVGSGVSGAVADGLMARFRALEANQSPFLTSPDGAVGWLDPSLVAEIAYEGFTGEGRLRQASFKGLREDKAAQDVATPADAVVTPRAIHMVNITHPEKLLWPEDGITKADLAQYYAAVAPRLLEYVEGRAISIVRAPDGIHGMRFFQRHVIRGQSALIHAVTVREEKEPYLMIDCADGLAALAQLGALELHPWGARVADIEHPDRLVFDLDPDEGLAFSEVIRGALEIRRRLAAMGLESFVKTTGGKGLHVLTPLTPRAEWPEAKAFARALCEAMCAEFPDRYVAVMSKRARVGRIFLDYLRNDSSATAVAAWSPRARVGATVSMPLSWRQLGPKLDPGAFTIRSAPALLQRVDPWAGFLGAARPLPAVKGL